MARPSKLDPERVDRLVQAIRLGATYELACKYAGISFQTFLNWQYKGAAQASGMYREFADRIAESEGQAVVKWLAVIEKASTGGDWRAAMAKLERRYPEQYGRTVTDHHIKDRELEQAADRLVAKTGRDRAAILAELRERTAAIDRERKAG